jgi:hypothetical protein
MSLDRYYVRWRTNLVDGRLVIAGWDVCDQKKFDKIALASFADNEEDKADAVCKLMNSIEEETNA